MQKNTFLWLYAPFTTCCDKSKLFERILIDHYLELWYSDTRNQTLWLQQLGDSQKNSLQEAVRTNSVPHDR